MPGRTAYSRPPPSSLARTARLPRLAVGMAATPASLSLSSSLLSLLSLLLVFLRCWTRCPIGHGPPGSISPSLHGAYCSPFPPLPSSLLWFRILPSGLSGAAPYVFPSGFPSLILTREGRF